MHRAYNVIVIISTITNKIYLYSKLINKTRRGKTRKLDKFEANLEQALRYNVQRQTTKEDQNIFLGGAILHSYVKILHAFTH